MEAEPLGVIKQADSIPAGNVGEPACDITAEQTVQLNPEVKHVDFLSELDNPAKEGPAQVADTSDEMLLTHKGQDGQFEPGPVPRSCCGDA